MLNDAVRAFSFVIIASVGADVAVSLVGPKVILVGLKVILVGPKVILVGPSVTGASVGASVG